eukprot:4883191-Alexandrium_andersonii.AAC.1
MRSRRRAIVGWLRSRRELVWGRTASVGECPSAARRADGLRQKKSSHFMPSLFEISEKSSSFVPSLFGCA